jgi:hypothetical protein
MLGLDIRQHVLTATAIIGGSFLIFTLGFWWLITDITFYTTQLIQSEQSISSYLRAQQSLPRITRDAETANAFSSTLKQFLPADDQLFSVSSWMQAQARLYRVEFNFSFSGNQNPATASRPGSVGFLIRASGSLADISRFLTDIEHSAPRFAFILSDITIDRLGADTHRLSATGTLFFRSSDYSSSSTPRTP